MPGRGTCFTLGGQTRCFKTRFSSDSEADIEIIDTLLYDHVITGLRGKQKLNQEHQVALGLADL